MMTTDTEARIIAIVADWTRTSPDRLSAAISLRHDLDASPAEILEIVMDVEDGFNLIIPDADYQSWKTIGDIVTYVEERRES